MAADFLDISLLSSSELSMLAFRVREMSAQYEKEVPYFKTLVGLRAALAEEYMLYPHHCCVKASRKVTEMLGLQYGVQGVAGYYIQGMMPHAWNYDVQRELFIDLTLDQFYAGFPTVAIMPEDIFLLKIDDNIVDNFWLARLDERRGAR